MTYNKKADCTGCGGCRNVCPVGAIKMLPDAYGFLYPSVDGTLCTDCGACREICPRTGQNPVIECRNTYYALKGPIHYRRASTSGAAFRLLAECVLKENGIVFSAQLTEENKVIHSSAESETELCALLGSKYVQSDTGDVFSIIRELLKAGRKVLFCGTPCQTDGLQRCLMTQNVITDDLILVDLICAGVSSPAFFDRYIDHLGRPDGKVRDFRFRDKLRGNAGHTVSWYRNGEFHAEPYLENKFCRIYTKQLGLRQSCYSCKYTTPDRVSDITLGDFWGNEHLVAHMDDGYGISLVIAHTEKGRQLIGRIQCENTEILEIHQEISLQPRLTEPPKSSLLNVLFMKDLSANGDVRSCDMELILKKYGC